MDREKYLELKEEIHRKWEQVKAQDTTDTEALPKVSMDKNLKELIKIGNNTAKPGKRTCAHHGLAKKSVPHSWKLKVMEVYKVSPTLIKFMKHSMNTWETMLTLNHSNRSITSRPIKIKSDIFQGDSLPP
ncbi:uncharacterized protein LOC115229030 [Octopus sinensis]|uniref:Uncharacterized protein LOC115229030 n=1 Tax=Octopus sinensis TaxID=2607531 RepID=A0A6P7TU75_9MOLL|nr:uncharacterized protein LOC115229030 [Octopus sinensis]